MLDASLSWMGRKMFEKILIATDFSETSRAAFWAAVAMGRTFQSQLFLLHVDTRLYLGPQISPDQNELHVELETWLPQSFYKSSRTEIVNGISAAHEILKIANDQSFDLIAIGAHGRSSLSHLLLGSETLKVIRKAQCPVMVVKNFSASHADRWQADKILIPTDFSDVAGRALELGGRLADALGSQLHFIHVLDLPALEEIHAKYWRDKLDLKEASQLNVDSVLKGLVERAGIKASTKLCTLSGDPPKEILHYAQNNGIDLVLMGTHGRKSLERVLMGSVTAGVLHAAECPVITVSTSPR